MKKILSLILGMLLLTSCSTIVGEVKQIVGDDLSRTSELAAKYGKSDVKKCADFLNAALNSQDSAQAKIDALLAEPTAGLLSGALKAALVAEFVKSLNDPASQAKFEKEFDANCSAVAGKIMINLVRDARKIGSRGIGR